MIRFWEVISLSLLILFLPQHFAVYIVNSVNSNELIQQSTEISDSENNQVEYLQKPNEQNLDSLLYLHEAKLPQILSLNIKSYSTIGELKPRKSPSGRLENEINKTPLNVEIVNSPPPHEQVAKMARYIVTNSNWSSIATISSRNPTKTYPFANVVSLSDGNYGNGTGIPYMYLTPLELSVIDLTKDPRASLTMSLAQSHYCYIHNYDPEDPRCCRIILTGNIVKLAKNSTEYEIGKRALFLRHPVMDSWPKDHGWFVAKLNVENILVLDYFGGAKTVSVKDYFETDSLKE